ncbi:MAG: hypothetical protein NZ699_09920 [Roseiflexus sp.]|nr:hypothetical protein [Roseiflexus sp.]MCS7289432.1 hypothetical protein [Roseiflexus sp.]MDW8233907.1 hypothetical protein [Roseiflexaceae bacterium]
MNTTKAAVPWQTSKALLPSLAHLYGLIPLAVITALIALAPTDPHDFWWHLRIGQIVAESGVPRTNMFAWTVPIDQPFVYAAWLGDWLFYQTYRLAGLQGPVLARNILGALAFALVLLDAYRRSGSWRLAGLAVFLAGAMTINNLTTRPQNWAWAPFMAYVIILGAYAARQVGRRALLALPLLMVFWVNAHGSFILGLALLALYCIGEGLRTLLRHPDAPGPQRLAALGATAAATLVAVVINPTGIQIFVYVVSLLTNPPVQGLVNEWQPPTVRSLAGQAFFLATLLLIAALALGRRRLNLTETLLLCAFLWLAWSSARHVVWFGMLAMPMLAQCLAHSTARLVSQRGDPFAGLVVLALVAGVVALQPPFKPLLALPAPYRDLFANVPGAPLLYSADTPVGAAAYLRDHAGGRLFNDMAYGSYLIWALPKPRVFVDTRVELYPLALWEDYLALSEARDYTILIERYGIDRALLSRSRQAPLVAALASDPDWVVEYEDRFSILYRRER